MKQWMNQLQEINLVTVILLGIILFSLYEGYKRGAFGSASRLFTFVMEGFLTVIALLATWKMAVWLSPVIQEWMVSLNIEIPNKEIGFIEQMYYTLVTGIRDFSLLRMGIIFIIGFMIVKNFLYMIIGALLRIWERKQEKPAELFNFKSNFANGIVGGTIGSIMGVVRSILLIAIMFIYVSLLPQAPFTGYIQASEAYQKGADLIIQPITGDFFENQLPVFTRAVEDEFSKILQRKYEIIDHRIPDNIAEAAKQITKDANSDEEKARALYQWVGTRIQYDWEKVRVYEEENIWREQMPEDTFATKLGVCIDLSRLYAVMARAVNLEVKVVTGLGYDGRGGYGPHAWNEVYLSEQKRWVPLDTTWVASGGNWFNPPNFYDSHVKDA